MVALRRKTTRPDQSLTDWLLFRRSYYSERAALCTFFFGSVSWSLADRNVSFPLPKEGKRSSKNFRCLPTGMLDFQTLQEGHLNKYTKLSLRLKGSDMHIFSPGLLQIGMFHFHFLKRGWPDQSLTDWLKFRRSYYPERAALCTFCKQIVSWSLADRNASFPLPKEGKRSSICFWLLADRNARFSKSTSRTP